MPPETLQHDTSQQLGALVDFSIDGRSGAIQGRETSGLEARLVTAKSEARTKAGLKRGCDICLKWDKKQDQTKKENRE
jgi:hypothetical protein